MMATSSARGDEVAEVDRMDALLLPYVSAIIYIM
jgi:hypothetical protein